MAGFIGLSEESGGAVMKRVNGVLISAATFWALAIISGFFIPDFCHAGLKWKTIGPEGDSVPSIAIDPNNSSIVFAGSDGGGVFKSTNGGDNWSLSDSGLTGTPIRALSHRSEQSKHDLCWDSWL